MNDPLGPVGGEQEEEEREKGREHTGNSHGNRHHHGRLPPLPPESVTEAASRPLQYNFGDTPTGCTRPSSTTPPLMLTCERCSNYNKKHSFRGGSSRVSHSDPSTAQLQRATSIPIEFTTMVATRRVRGWRRERGRGLVSPGALFVFSNYQKKKKRKKNQAWCSSKHVVCELLTRLELG